MNEIKSNLGSNEELNKKYLSSQIEVYKDHPYNKEIIKEISRLMWDCLSESQKQEFADISNKENPIMDILNDIYYDIEEENYETPLKKLEKFMESFPSIFEDDKVNEYHFFTNPLEEMIFRKYIGLKKELRYIPDNQPLLDLYYVYGFLLLESQQYDKAEEYLKKAIKINPVSSRIILELTEIYKVHTYTFNEYFIRTCDALQYAYYPQDIARCYRNLGYYYIEENQMETALALLIYRYTAWPSPEGEGVELEPGAGGDVNNTTGGLFRTEDLKAVGHAGHARGPGGLAVDAVGEVALPGDHEVDLFRVEGQAHPAVLAHRGDGLRGYLPGAVQGEGVHRLGGGEGEGLPALLQGPGRKILGPGRSQISLWGARTGHRGGVVGGGENRVGQDHVGVGLDQQFADKSLSGGLPALPEGHLPKPAIGVGQVVGGPVVVVEALPCGQVGVHGHGVGDAEPVSPTAHIVDLLFEGVLRGVDSDDL